MCSLCGDHTSAAGLAEDAEKNAHTLAVTTMYCQLVRYGWASYDSVLNAMGDSADPAVLAGLFPGLQRAGLIERIPEPPSAAQVAAFITISKPRPTYGPGPLFPAAARKEGVRAGS